MRYKCNMTVQTNGRVDQNPWASPFVPQISAFVSSGNFRVCFWRSCIQHIFQCPNSRINKAAKPCQRLLKAFNHPINSRWVQATMPHYEILWWDVSWSSDTCENSGANDSFSPSLICSLASWRPKRPNKQTMLNVHKISDDFRKTNVSENVSKNVFVWNNMVFQTITKHVHTYG